MCLSLCLLWVLDTVTKSYIFTFVFYFSILEMQNRNVFSRNRNAVHETNNTKYALKKFEIVSPLLTKLNTDPNVFSLSEEQKQMPI